MATNDKAKANKTSFKKGQSGNPGGRAKERVTPEGLTLSQLARKNTCEALEVLREIYLDKTNEAKDRLVAAQAMLTRGHGAPKPQADEEPGDSKTVGEELLALLSKNLPD